MDDEAGLGTTCYRHPDRPSAIHCQRCSKTICTACMVPAPVGFHCPDCVATAARSTRQLHLGPAEGIPYLTYALIAANVLVALAGLATDSRWVSGHIGTIDVDYGLLGGGFTGNRFALKLVGVDAGEWYRIFTGAFLHAGPIHLGFNMLFLWLTGMLLEPLLGRLRFALLYLVALLGGSFGALLAAPHTITVGASGAIFGLMGALFIAERRGMFGGRRSSIGFLIVINLVFSFATPGISIGGHVGGLAAGGATGWMFQEFDRRRLPPILGVGISLVLALASFLLCLWAASLWKNPIF